MPGACYPAGMDARNDRQIYSGLQALRAAAALLVLVQHAVYFPCWATSTDSDWFIRLEPGIVGVFVFFVVSGAVMALATSNDGAAKFAFSRILRIYPPFFLSMFLAALVLSAVGATPRFIPDLSMLLLPTGDPNSTFHVPYWTLIYEMQFYALLWLAALCKSSHRLRVWLAIAWAGIIMIAGSLVLQIPVATPNVWQIVLSPLNVYFVFGYVLASALMTKDWRPLMALIVGVSLGVIYFNGWPQHYLVLAVLCVSAVFIAISLKASSVPRWASKLGDYSYGLYLTHVQVIVAIVTIDGVKSWPLWVTIPVCFVIGGGVGLAFGVFEQWLYQRCIKPLVRQGLGTTHPVPGRAVAN